MICYGCMTNKSNDEETCPNCGYINGQEHEEHYYLKEGTLLNGRYIVGKILGHGGFGITYIGLDNKLEVKVAIKEYLPSDVATRSEGQSIVKSFSGEKGEQYDYGLSRFLDEARNLAKYNHHPCIVSTSDFFEENNTAYIIMEYLEGISLNEYLNRKGGKISWDETMEIMTPIMDALREVHSTGMIHRDISPDNIHITSTGQVKLLDFGAARFALGEKSKSLSVILKPGYAPPEQYTSRGKQGTWTDVYSVAATMYRCVEGVKIHEAMDRMLEPELKFDTWIPESLQEVLSSALSIKVTNRLQTIDDLQQKLIDSNLNNVKIKVVEPDQGHSVSSNQRQIVDREVKIKEVNKRENTYSIEEIRKRNEEKRRGEVEYFQRNNKITGGQILSFCIIISIVLGMCVLKVLTLNTDWIFERSEVNLYWGFLVVFFHFDILVIVKTRLMMNRQYINIIGAVVLSIIGLCMLLIVSSLEGEGLMMLLSAFIILILYFYIKSKPIKIVIGIGLKLYLFILVPYLVGYYIDRLNEYSSMKWLIIFSAINLLYTLIVFRKRRVYEGLSTDEVIDILYEEV